MRQQESIGGIVIACIQIAIAGAGRSFIVALLLCSPNRVLGNLLLMQNIDVTVKIGGAEFVCKDR
jgi:hypothetical protein